MRTATETSLEQRTGNVGGSSFYIEELTDSFRLHNVPYGGGLAVLTWDKKYLDEGREHSQEEWLSLSDEVPGILAYHATITSLAQNRGGSQSALVKKVSAMFQEDFENNFMATSTRVKYRLRSPDSVIHWYRSEKQRIVEVPFVGSDSWITANSGLEEQMQALLGTQNLQEIEHSYSTFRGKNPYLWRLNSRSTRDTERAVWVGIGSDGFGLDCNLSPIYYLGRSRRVRVECAAGARAENEELTTEKKIILPQERAVPAGEFQNKYAPVSLEDSTVRARKEEYALKSLRGEVRGHTVEDFMNFMRNGK